MPKYTSKALNEFAARMKEKYNTIFYVSFANLHDNLVFVQSKENYSIYTIGYYFSLEDAEKVIHELYK